MVQLHRLEGFYWVGRTGGYAKAARAFPYPITQPAVHQQVKKLEAELGVSLFERVDKESIQTTAAGRRLYESCFCSKHQEPCRSSEPVSAQALQ